MASIPPGKGKVAVRCAECHLAPGEPFRVGRGKWLVACKDFNCWSGPYRGTAVKAITAWNKIMTLTRWEVKP